MLRSARISPLSTGAAMSDLHEGGCICGAIRYRTHGKPERVAACYCTFCQKRTGGALSIHAWFPESAVELIGSSLSTYETRSDENNNWLRLHFCARCGTTVMITLEKRQDVRLITAGTLDDPNSVKIDAHIFTRSAQQWMAFPKNAACFETTSFAGVRREPTTR